MKFWNRARYQMWAISSLALQHILELAEKHNESPEAIAAKIGKDLDNTYNAVEREGVAILSIAGPLFRYSNFFTSFFGASSYERIAHDFTQALNNPDIKSIIFDFDSPGGEVNGCSELANLIFESRGEKPIIAYASGDCASGAYWIASACDRIVVSDTAQLGSIGVVAVYHNRRGDDSEIEIVSSQSPNKRLDPSVDKDREKIQTRIDALADVFINAVAQHRRVSSDIVKTDYGQGDVVVGRIAIGKGLADSHGTYEKLLQELTSTSPSHSTLQGSESPSVVMTEENTMDIDTLKKEHLNIYQQVIIKGVTQERQRIQTILECEEAKDKATLAQHLAFNTDLSSTIVQSTLQQIAGVQAADQPTKTPEQTTPAPEEVSGFTQVMASINNPRIEPKAEEAEESGDDEMEATVKRIAQYSTPIHANSGGNV